ncbi:hypothetical protein BN14_11851 [Rhizoctonia solani AG-1 IB]|uniref:CCL2-like lectin domain-containing protein n=1 Tax=Thanatephorus cucumeris (strain AG1-IB / isolate 7/3/14) TaxID=1108050 RepID=M5CHD8_THACB|nr:hypothetical protein BN14_11851 [Rhizoctonia solani AG-1 IB]
MIFTTDQPAEESAFQLDAGVYIIYNRVLSPTGQRLAMTFNETDEPITVTPLDPSSPNQRWVIENYEYDQQRATTLQHVKPQMNQELEAGWGESIVVLPAGDYVWGITKDGSAYTIKDGDKEISWSIHSAIQGSNVVPVQDATGEKQRWIFHQVDTALPF